MIHLINLPTLFSLLLIVFTVKPSFAVAYDVAVACYFHAEPRPSYEFLKDSDGTMKYVSARFDAQKAAHLVQPGMRQQLENECAEQLALKDKSLHEIKGTTKIAQKSSFGLIGIHIDILNEDHEQEEQTRKDANEVFEKLDEDVEFDNDITAGDQTDSETKKFLQRISAIDSLEVPIEQFISTNTAVDFPRDDIKVKVDGTTIYEQVRRVAKNLLKGTETRHDNQEILYSTEPFQLMEKQLLENNPNLDRLKLRKNLARALHTRSQGYEAPSLLYLMGQIAEHNTQPERLVFSVNEGGRALHEFDVKGSTLVLNSFMDYKINTAMPYNLKIGIFTAERVVEMDMETGKFSTEKFSLFKFSFPK